MTASTKAVKTFGYSARLLETAAQMRVQSMQPFLSIRLDCILIRPGVKFAHLCNYVLRLEIHGATVI